MAGTAPGPTATMPTQQPEALGTTLLLIEDDTALASAWRDWLQSDGYTVALAADGLTGLRHLEAARPDLILLDLVLPDVDGLVLLAQLRERSSVPIVICSATGRKPDAI